MLFEAVEFSIFVETNGEKWIGIGHWAVPDVIIHTWKFLVDNVTKAIHKGMDGFMTFEAGWKIKVYGQRVTYKGLEAMKVKRKVWGAIWDSMDRIEWSLVEGEVWNLARRMADGEV